MSEIQVEVVYAGLKNQWIIPLRLMLGVTIMDAIEASNLLNVSQELGKDIKALEGRVGIFGKILPLARVLKKGDRVEIYRSLIQDPKEARRIRAKKQK